MEVVVANARRALLVLLWVRVKVGGFDSWLLGEAIGDDEALDAATRMDKQIAVSVLLFIGTGGGELAVGFWSSVRIRRRLSVKIQVRAFVDASHLQDAEHGWME